MGSAYTTMKNNLANIGIVYLFVISLVAIGFTIYDKRAARKGAWRVKESTLLMISLFGGSAAMLAVMLAARHKTKHLKFMLGIPVIIAMQVVAAVCIWHLLAGGT